MIEVRAPSSQRTRAIADLMAPGAVNASDDVEKDVDEEGDRDMGRTVGI